MVTEVVTVLYLTVPIAGVISWVPQIVRLIKKPILGIGMSLPTWFMWSAMGVITLVYAAVVVKGIPFIVASVVNAVGCVAVTYLAIFARVMNKARE